MNKLIIITFVFVFICYIYVSYVENDLKLLENDMYNNVENFTVFRDNNFKYPSQKLKEYKGNNLNSYDDKTDFDKSLQINKYYKNIDDDLLLTKDQFVQPKSQDFFTLYNIMKTTYLNYMSDINVYARNAKNINVLIAKYEKCCTQILNKEIVIFNNNFKKMYQSRINNYLKEWLDSMLKKIKIVKGATWLEDGMPHTHGEFIIFNPSMFVSFQPSTFIHELTHVHQRIIPREYHNLYHQWGFHYYNIKEIKGFEQIVKRNRSNPDGMDCNWILKNVCKGRDYWIGAVFNSNTPNSLSACYLEAYPLVTKDDGTIVYENEKPESIPQFDDFKKLFCVSSNHYHPNEIVAQYMEYYFNSKKLKCKNYNIFVEWFENLEY